MGFDLLSKVFQWLAGRQSKAKDPANTVGDSSERANKLKRSSNKEDTSDRIFKYRRVDNTFPKFMPNDDDDYSHMANKQQRNGQQENNTNQTQKRLSIFSEPQTRQTRVRNTQSPVNVDLSDTEEQHHIESNMYQAFADRFAGSATKPTYSDAVRYGTNGFAADLNYLRPSSSSSSSDARLNGHAGNMFNTGTRRTSMITLEHQRSEKNQYINLINTMSLHDGDRMIRPTTSRGSEKPMPPKDIQHIGSRGDEWLRGVIHNKIKPQEPIASERDEYAKLLQQEQRKPNPLIKKGPPYNFHSYELGGDITDLSTISNDSKGIAKDLKMQPLPLLRTKAVQERQSSSIYFAENFEDHFKEKRERMNQEANHTKKLVLQEVDQITKERRAYEQMLREALSKRRVLAQTMFVLEKYPKESDEDSVPEFVQLTEDHIKQYNELVFGKPDKVLVSKFSLSITRKDIRTLIGSCWLNDEVINFYMNLLTDRSEQKDTLPSVYAMNTFFVPRLLQGYSNVRRWTRRVDIFSKDIIPVPVHVSNVHWCMAIIHMKNKTIRYYDSMGKPNSEVLHALEKYLQEESLDKRKKPFDTSDFVIENVQNVPHQTNGSDCGVFSCMFAEYITRNKQLTFSQADMEYFRKKMVLEICGGELWM